MEIMREVIEHAPATVTVAVPLALQEHPIEIIVLPLAILPSTAHLPVKSPVNSVQRSKRRSKKTVVDPDILHFFGLLPDFPEREQQGEFDQRETLG
jgi:hypothetical protein